MRNVIDFTVTCAEAVEAPEALTQEIEENVTNEEILRHDGLRKERGSRN